MRARYFNCRHFNNFLLFQFEKLIFSLLLERYPKYITSKTSPELQQLITCNEIAAINCSVRLRACRVEIGLCPEKFVVKREEIEPSSFPLGVECAAPLPRANRKTSSTRPWRSVNSSPGIWSILSRETRDITSIFCSRIFYPKKAGN